MSHTAEPWFVVGAPWGNATWINAGSEDPHGLRFVADCLDAESQDNERAQENARRIVACVNRCAGVTTEHLENLSVMFVATGKYSQLVEQLSLKDAKIDHITNALIETEKQRDDLLEALTRAMAKVESATSCHPNALRYLLDEAMEICGAAYAAAKGHNALAQGPGGSSPGPAGATGSASD